MPPPPRTGGPPVTNIRNTSSRIGAVERGMDRVVQETAGFSMARMAWK
jgi:hypothetical protein